MLIVEKQDDENVDQVVVEYRGKVLTKNVKWWAAHKITKVWFVY